MGRGIPVTHRPSILLLMISGACALITRAGLLVSAAVLLLAACGSAGSSAGQQASGQPSSALVSSPSVSSPSATTGVAGLRPCRTSQLRVTVGTTGGAAAGTSYLPLDFTNVSGRSCILSGYPRVSFVMGSPGRQVGDAGADDINFGPVTVTVASGASAHAWLGIAAVGNYPPSQCAPVTARRLRVYPPGQSSPLYAGIKAWACSKNISNSSPLLITPVRSGPGIAGRIP